MSRRALFSGAVAPQLGFALIALSVLFGTLPALTQPRSAPAEVKNWQKFDSKDGRFKVLMPKPPELQQQSFPLQGTKLKIQMYLFTAQDPQPANNGAAYLVTYADFPFIPTTPEAADFLLDASQSQMLANNTLLARSSFQLKGNPGRELKLRDTKGTLSRVRLFLVKERIYMVAVFSGSEQGLSANGKRFLDSFELVNK